MQSFVADSAGLMALAIVPSPPAGGAAQFVDIERGSCLMDVSQLDAAITARTRSRPLEPGPSTDAGTIFLRQAGSILK